MPTSPTSEVRCECNQCPGHARARMSNDDGEKQGVVVVVVKQYPNMGARWVMVMMHVIGMKAWCEDMFQKMWPTYRNWKMMWTK